MEYGEQYLEKRTTCFFEMSSAVSGDTATPDSTEEEQENEGTATPNQQEVKLEAATFINKQEDKPATSDQLEDKPEQPDAKDEDSKTVDETEPEVKAAASEPQQQDNSATTQKQPLQEEKAAEKSEAAPLKPAKASPLEEKIIRQVEFYFGDRNFPKDKFLQQAAESDSEGWVPLATLLTFNRLKALSSDAEVIAAALNKSTAEVVQVSEDGKRVRRHPEKAVPDIFAADFRKEVMERSIYAKGFPEETKLDEIQEFMDQYGKVHYIQMRRIPVDKEKKFKGSIFVEFEQVEDAEKFVKQDKVQFNDIDLLVEWKSDYFKRKQEERKQKKEAAKNNLMKSKKDDGEEDGEGKSEPVSMVKTSGCILHFSCLAGDKSREDLREDLLPFGTVAFVDFDRGKTEGYVRFREEGGAKRAREGLLDRAVGGAGVAQLCGSDVELKVLEGEEEEQYWCKVMEGSFSGKEKKGGRRGGRGGGRGGRGRGRGNARKRRDRSLGGDGESKPPETKTAKTED